VSVRLNLFQSTMLCWRDVYPYNAVHVVSVALPLDAARLDREVSLYLAELGLTSLDLDRRRRRYQWRAGAEAVSVRALAGAGDASAVIREEIERQLNAAFPNEGHFHPLRFFAVDAGAQFHLGVAYDHFIAAGDSMARLLAGIAARYAGAGAPAKLMTPPTVSYARLFRRQAIPLILGLARAPAMMARNRRSFRPRLAVPEDGRNAFMSFRLDAKDNATISRVASEWSATRNDLVLALLLKALSPLAIGRRTADRRTELAVASIVNIRGDFGPGAKYTLAPLLASFQISHPVPEGVALRTLVEAINAETRRIKRGKRYLQTLLALSIAVARWRFMSAHRRYRFFARHHPVWAGTTPLSVTSLWAEAGYPGPAPEYLRGVSTGPHTPMVVALSTSGDVTNVGISFRTTVFEYSTIHGFAADILREIKSLQCS
jgi:hypothetical protein